MNPGRSSALCRRAKHGRTCGGYARRKRSARIVREERPSAWSRRVRARFARRDRPDAFSLLDEGAVRPAPGMFRTEGERIQRLAALHREVDVFDERELGAQIIQFFAARRVGRRLRRSAIGGLGRRRFCDGFATRARRRRRFQIGARPVFACRHRRLRGTRMQGRRRCLGTLPVVALRGTAPNGHGVGARTSHRGTRGRVRRRHRRHPSARCGHLGLSRFERIGRSPRRIRLRRRDRRRRSRSRRMPVVSGEHERARGDTRDAERDHQAFADPGTVKAAS